MHSMSTTPALAASRRLVLPTASGELVLQVPAHFAEPTLLKEIAGQDVLGRRDAVHEDPAADEEHGRGAYDRKRFHELRREREYCPTQPALEGSPRV